MKLAYNRCSDLDVMIVDIMMLKVGGYNVGNNYRVAWTRRINYPRNPLKLKINRKNIVRKSITEYFSTV